MINLKFHDAVKNQERNAEAAKKLSEAPTTTETLTKAAGGLLSTMGFGGLRKTFWSKDQQQNESIENAPSKRSKSKESKSKTEAPKKEEGKSGVN